MNQQCQNVNYPYETTKPKINLGKKMMKNVTCPTYQNKKNA